MVLPFPIAHFGVQRISTHPTLASKIIAHWRLNEISGTRYDAHSSNHLTDYNTVGYAAGKIGNAAAFVSANSEYLRVADTADLSFGDENFSFTFWFYTNDLSKLQAAFYKGSDGNTEYEYLCRYFDSYQKFAFGVYYSGTSGGIVWSDVVPAANTWYFVYCYHNAATNEIGISLNNGAAQTASYSNGCHDGANPFSLGRFLTSYLDGRLDSFSVWSDVLTASELADLYNNGRGMDY